MRQLRERGWEHGDRRIVKALGEGMLLLVRRPARSADAFTGRLTHVFGTPDEGLTWTERERASWAEGQKE